MKNRLILLIVVFSALPVLADQKQVLSDVYPITQKYKSMEGPSGTEVVREDGKTLKYKALFSVKRYPAARLITISQGMRVPSGGFEARVPEGFAFPIASNEPLLVNDACPQSQHRASEESMPALRGENRAV